MLIALGFTERKNFSVLQLQFRTAKRSNVVKWTRREEYTIIFKF